MVANSAIDSAAGPAAVPETGLLGERLTAGDYVTAAWNVYQQRFKVYFRLSLQANLWLLVPVYGWGKFCAGLGTIARLAFNEATNRKESLSDTRRIAEANKWNIFLAGFLAGLLAFGINLAASISSAILTIVGAAIASLFGSSAFAGLVTAVFSIGGQLALTVVSYWFYARFFLVEVPLVASSERTDPVEAIGRSWQVTRLSAWTIVTAIFVGGLMVLPLTGVIIALIGIFVGISVGAVAALGENAAGLVALIIAIGVILTFLTILGLGTVLMPLWQTLKGLIYVDLCDRREGLGLQLACEERGQQRVRPLEED